MLGDPREQTQQGEPRQRERRLDERERPLLGREREDQVELQVAPRGADRLPDDEGGHARTARGRDRDVLRGEEPLEDGVAQLRGHGVGGSRRRAGRAGAHRARGAQGFGPGDEDRLERPGVAGVRTGPRRRQPVEGLVEGGLGAVAVGVDAGEVALEVLPTDVGLDEGRLLLALQETVGDLGLQDEAEHQHDDARHRDRGEHHAQLHRAAPQHPHRADPLGERELEATTQAREALRHRAPDAGSGRAGLVADAADGEHHLRVLRVRSTLERSRWTCTLTSRVSAACR